jgi:hypothetical protein
MIPEIPSARAARSKARPVLTDEEARARLEQLQKNEARITREIDARVSRRARLRDEAEALRAQLRGQLELPLLSRRRRERSAA